jgi:cyclopropane fatty-acyl-phospholipid synthase-like methyltransferase
MVIHSIGFCRSGQWNHGGWMNSYIFPGAELPTMSLAKKKVVAAM